MEEERKKGRKEGRKEEREETDGKQAEELFCFYHVCFISYTCGGEAYKERKIFCIWLII